MKATRNNRFYTAVLEHFSQLFHWSKARPGHVHWLHYSRLNQCCQVPKFFSGQYMKKVRPNREKVRPIYTYLHIKHKTAFSRRVNKIVNKFFSLSLSVCHNSKRRKFFQKISSAPFLPLLTKFGHNSAINSSGQNFFSPAPFELFGRNFGHLATLASTTALHRAPVWIYRHRKRFTPAFLIAEGGRYW
jgi:hypothetical protein